MTGPADPEATGERLFVYGTLRQPEVQRAVFGRPVEGVEATLFGWKIDTITISDERVLALSGTNIHRVLRPGGATDRVDGMILTLTQTELQAADEYETNDYKRMKAGLGAGGYAWVYVAKEG
ncbi:MAG: gamma-glutamylcyclotransferase family protein [Armatimonadota bacterium]